MSKQWRTAGVMILCGGLVVTFSLGIRHAFGLFLRPMSMDLGWGREVFSLAIALQNLVWGVAQPFTGALADRIGAGKVILGGTVLYVLGLVLMAWSSSAWELAGSAGVLIGLGLSGTTFSVVYGAVGRAVPAEKRIQALGVVGAAGSLGQFLMVPGGQALISSLGWLSALLAMAVIGAFMAPASIALMERRFADHARHRQSVREAIREAASHRGFQLLTLGFFVCGFQIVFIASHLPAYLMDQGQSVKVGVTALALVGFFNIIGTYVAGLLGGGRFPKRYLLSALYFARSVVIVVFLMVPLTPLSAALFGAAMGLLWLGTVPLTNGIVAQVFGVQHLSMLSGVVFLSHQVGSFLGVWLGGYLFDATGSYRMVWIICIALGIIAGLVNLPIDERPLAAPRRAPA